MEIIRLTLDCQFFLISNEDTRSKSKGGRMEVGGGDCWGGGTGGDKEETTVLEQQ